MKIKATGLFKEKRPRLVTLIGCFGKIDTKDFRSLQQGKAVDISNNVAEGLLKAGLCEPDSKAEKPPKKTAEESGVKS